MAILKPDKTTTLGGDSPQCGQCHQLKTYDSDGKWNGNEIFYEGKIC